MLRLSSCDRSSVLKSVVGEEASLDSETYAWHHVCVRFRQRRRGFASAGQLQAPPQPILGVHTYVVVGDKMPVVWGLTPYVKLMVRLKDCKGLFQPKWLYDSVKKWEWKHGKTQSEGTSDGLWSSLLLKAWSALQSHQVAQGFVQLGLWNLQGQRLHRPAWAPLPLVGCPHEENISLRMQSEPLVSTYGWCSLSSTMHRCERTGSLSSVTPTLIRSRWGCC